MAIFFIALWAEAHSRHFAQRGDLPEAAHPHFDDECFCVIRGVQDRDREALLVVEAALVRCGSQLGRTRGLDEILG